MWHFRHQYGIGALLLSYQLGTVNTVNVFSRKFSVKLFQERKMLCRFFFFTFSGFKIILHTVVFFLALIYFSDLFFFLEEKYSARSFHWRAREMWNCGGRVLFYCVVSSLHLESTKSLLITSLRLIGLWWVFENLLHGCTPASLEKGFTMKGLVV